MTLEHHRDLAREFPGYRHQIHELKQSSAEFRHLYDEYQALDNEVLRIEQEIETPSDEYVEDLKRRRARLKDQLYGLLTGRLHVTQDTEEYVVRGKFRVPVDPGEVRRDWAGRGYSCDPFSDPPGQVWRDYTHDVNELVTVVAGRLEIEMHGVRYTLEPGDELFIPRAGVHTVRNADAGETRWLYGYD
jgi:uncharacterized protein YdcH (DUF465 family)